MDRTIYPKGFVPKYSSHLSPSQTPTPIDDSNVNPAPVATAILWRASKSETGLFFFFGFSTIFAPERDYLIKLRPFSNEQDAKNYLYCFSIS